MRERGLEFKVGLLIIVAAVILAGFVFVLGNFSLGSGYTVYVDYDYSGNLQEGAPVKVAGIKVGKVKDVSFRAGALDPETGRRVYVRVTAWIEDRAKDSIRRDAEVFINTAGVPRTMRLKNPILSSRDSAAPGPTSTATPAG